MNTIIQEKREGAGSSVFTCHEKVAVLLKNIETMLDSIEKRPAMWGTAEVQEATVWVLVGQRQVLLGYPEFDTHEAMLSFVHAINGDFCSWFLCDLLKEENMLEELPRLLGDFQRWVAREWPPRELFR